VAFTGAYGTSAPGAYVDDLDTGTVTQVSLDMSGNPIAGSPLSLSDDGHSILLSEGCTDYGFSKATCDEMSGAPRSAVFVRNRAAGTTVLASVDSAGVLRDWGPLPFASMSGDGRYVVFNTSDMTMAADCAFTKTGWGGGTHVYEHDLVTGVTQRVDANMTAKLKCAADAWLASNHSVSDDGSYVAFTGMLGINGGPSNPETVFISRLR
jgi:hypothetical protein